MEPPSFKKLAHVHRGWCNYCQGEWQICRDTPRGGCFLRDCEVEIENASGDELVADLHAAGTIARAIGNAAPQAGKPRTAPRIAEEHPEKPAVAAPGATCIGLHEMQSQTSRKLEIRPPVMTGMTFGCDVIVNGQHIKAGTVVRFADPAAERKDLSELLWKLYEGLYGHRQAEGIDPFRTAVNGALEVKKAWDKL